MESLDLRDTFGAMLIGGFITMSIYGITTLQSYYYYISYPKDGAPLKVLVALIWFMDTLHVAFMCHAIYKYLILGFGNPLALADGTWSLYASVTINILMAVIVQSFFTQRIHILCEPRHRWWVSGIIALTVVTHFCLGMETVTFFFIKKAFAKLSEVSLSSALPFGIMAILSDFTIAGALCVLLHNNRSEFEDTNNVINKLIIFAINRCLLTSLVALIEVIIFLVMPHSFYFLALDFIIGKLYANSLLATLNSRNSLRNVELFVATEHSTNFNVASIVSNHRPTSLIHTQSHENTGSRNRVLADHDLKDLHTITTQKSSRRSYPSINS